jgi:integrase/recombinase XerC
MTPVPKTLTVTECHQLLDALIVKDGTQMQFRKGIRNYTMALLMLDAGLRVGEVVPLRSHHLYFNCGPVTAIVITPEIAKNKTERTIPISGRLTNALKTHAEHWGGFNNLFYDRPVFSTGPKGFPITTRQVERIIRAAAMKSIGRPVHPHVLRHTFASRLMRKVNGRIVQELLGHKNMSSTQIYTHPNQEDLKKAIDNIEEQNLSVEQAGVERYLPTNIPNRPDTAGTHRDVG